MMGIEKIKRISKVYKARIDTMTSQGISPLQIRKRFLAEDEISITTRAIKLYIQRRKKELETGVPTAVRKRPEKRIFKPEHIAYLNQIMESNDETTAPEIQCKLLEEFQLSVSLTTIRKERADLGWTATTARYCQLVRHVNKPKRLEYCENVVRTNEQFDDVVFTDESTIKIQSTVRRCFRRKDSPRSMKPMPKHPFQIHVWAGISRRGRTKIALFSGRMVSEGYQDILKKFFLPFVQRAYPEGHRLYQDNDPKHVSKSTKAWFVANNVNAMLAPPESPDLNPIELIWAALKYHLRKHVKPRNQEELVDGILNYWDNLSAETCNKYIDHLFKVVPAVITAKGAASGF